jgi:hypothetical protein
MRCEKELSEKENTAFTNEIKTGDLVICCIYLSYNLPRAVHNFEKELEMKVEKGATYACRRDVEVRSICITRSIVRRPKTQIME